MPEFIAVFERVTYDRFEHPHVERSYAWRQRPHVVRKHLRGRFARVGEWVTTQSARRADRFDSIQELRRVIEKTRLYDCYVADENDEVRLRGKGRGKLYSFRFCVQIVRREPVPGTNRAHLAFVEVWPKGQAIDALAALA